MEYDLIFEIKRSTDNGVLFLLPGIFFMLVGAGLVFFRGTKNPRKNNFIGSAILIISGFWTVSASNDISNSNSHLHGEYQSGNYEVVEGVVREFVPMPKEGHVRESFM